MALIHCPEKTHMLLDEACIAAMAPGWPHDCADPTCPGAVNKHRLEAAEALATAVTPLLAHIQARIASNFRPNVYFKGKPLEQVAAAGVALARWREVTK